MIPDNISLEHILKAIDQIDKNGEPTKRRSRKFLLLFKGRSYSPKYVVALANEFANGEFLDSEDFSGGHESNSFLRGLGFEIVDKARGKVVLPAASSITETKRSSPSTSTVHNERCPECKKRVEQLLTRLYGKVVTNYKINTKAQIINIDDPYLTAIYKTLSQYRDYTDFTRSFTLPHCDFYIPSKNMLVEFDESQHFTMPRRLTLDKYPSELKIGFNLARWKSLCVELNRQDNDPPDRDEQRAWYDTLRDFLPRLEGFNPTIRLYSRDREWCKLNPDSNMDLQQFQSIIEPVKPEISIQGNQNPSLGRIIIAGPWVGKVSEAIDLIDYICKSWLPERKVKLLMTCGGFLQFTWPNLSRKDILDNKHPDPHSVKLLLDEARNCVDKFLTSEIKSLLKRRTRYISLGVDSFKDKVSTTQNQINELHTELVCIYDLVTEREYWTGKSYPTPGQEKGLVRIVEYDSHFIDLEEIGSVMVLGCHDLSVFNNRNWAKTGAWRRKIKNDIRELAKNKRPVCVLHHPHTTVKTRTWLNSWSFLQNSLTTVDLYLGAGRYYEADRERSKWDELNQVLKSTQLGPTINFVYHS